MEEDGTVNEASVRDEILVSLNSIVRKHCIPLIEAGVANRDALCAVIDLIRELFARPKLVASLFLDVDLGNSVDECLLPLCAALTRRISSAVLGVRTIPAGQGVFDGLESTHYIWQLIDSVGACSIEKSLPDTDQARFAHFWSLLNSEDAERLHVDGPGSLVLEKWKRNSEMRRILATFSETPESALHKLVDLGFCSHGSSDEIAEFLMEFKVDRGGLGTILGSRDRESISILSSVVKQFDFTGKPFLDSLKQFLSVMRLPGEGQKIDRILEAFALRFQIANSSSWTSFEAVHVLAYASVMLNTDLHSSKVKTRMIVEEFCEMCKVTGCDTATLSQIYYSIKENPILDGPPSTTVSEAAFAEISKMVETIKTLPVVAVSELQEEQKLALCLLAHVVSSRCSLQWVSDISLRIDSETSAAPTASQIRKKGLASVSKETFERQSTLFGVLGMILRASVICGLESHRDIVFASILRCLKPSVQCSSAEKLPSMAPIKAGLAMKSVLELGLGFFNQLGSSRLMLFQALSFCDFVEQSQRPDHAAFRELLTCFQCSAGAACKELVPLSNKASIEALCQIVAQLCSVASEELSRGKSSAEKSDGAEKQSSSLSISSLTTGRWGLSPKNRAREQFAVPLILDVLEMNWVRLVAASESTGDHLLTVWHTISAFVQSSCVERTISDSTRLVLLDVMWQVINKILSVNGSENVKGLQMDLMRQVEVLCSTSSSKTVKVQCLSIFEAHIEHRYIGKVKLGMQEGWIPVFDSMLAVISRCDSQSGLEYLDCFDHCMRLLSLIQRWCFADVTTHCTRNYARVLGAMLSSPLVTRIEERDARGAGTSSGAESRVSNGGTTYLQSVRNALNDLVAHLCSRTTGSRRSKSNADEPHMNGMNGHNRIPSIDEGGAFAGGVIEDSRLDKSNLVVDKAVLTALNQWMPVMHVLSSVVSSDKEYITIDFKQSAIDDIIRIVSAFVSHSAAGRPEVGPVLKLVFVGVLGPLISELIHSDSETSELMYLVTALASFTQSHSLETGAHYDVILSVFKDALGSSSEELVRRALSSVDPLIIPTSECAAFLTEVLVDSLPTRLIAYGASPSGTPDAHRFDDLVCRCVVQLGISRLVKSTFCRGESELERPQVSIASSSPSKACMEQLVLALIKSYELAARFNADVSLRESLKHDGFMAGLKGLPGLLKQEKESATVALRLSLEFGFPSHFMHCADQLVASVRELETKTYSRRSSRGLSSLESRRPSLESHQALNQSIDSTTEHSSKRLEWICPVVSECLLKSLLPIFVQNYSESREHTSWSYRMLVDAVASEDREIRLAAQRALQSTSFAV